MSVVPLLLAVSVSIYHSQEALRAQAVNHLTAVRNLKARQVETYLAGIAEDIRLVSRLPNVIKAVQQLEIAAEGLGLDQVRKLGFLGRPDLHFLTYYDPYSIYHGMHHAFFGALAGARGYADVWLVSLTGDLIYSYAKREDFGTVLLDGPAAPARLIRDLTAAPDDRVILTDYRPYPPANNARMSFVGGIITEKAEPMGILVYALSLNKITALMENHAGLGETGDTYLLGADRVFRSRPRFNENPRFFEQSVDNPAAEKGVLGRTGADVVQNYRNAEVLCAYQPIMAGGLEWVLLAEMETAEAFGPANRLRNLMILIIFMVTILVVAAGWRIGRSIADPVVTLSRTAARIAGGDLDLSVRARSRDEIGDMADAFNAMTGRLKSLIHDLKQEIAVRRRAEEKLTERRDRLEDAVKARTRELALARDRAESAARAKSEFLANMSHEIRTPMNAVLGLLNLILRTEVTDKQQDYLEKIRTSSRALLGIIDDILDFSKIEAGKLTIESIPFSLDEVLENLSNLISLKAREKGLEFLISVPPDMPAVLRGDPLRLGQVLINLCANAVKFTEHGEILLNVETADAPVKAADNALTLRFSVSDTGIGMNGAQITDLFKPFSQGDRSTTRKYGGSGLGLAISRQLVEMMGGRISVTSGPGRGSRFSFILTFRTDDGEEVKAMAGGAGVDGFLPEPAGPSLLFENVMEAFGRAEAAETAASAGAFGGTPGLDQVRGARMLLAEDNELNQQVAVELLESEGFVVSVAGNGLEALAMIKEAAAGGRPFDAVLMDIQMPEMDGYQAVAEIRKLDPPAGDAPVIAMTAHVMESEKQKCFQAGMNDFVTKPIDPAQLFRTLVRQLPPGKRPPAPDASTECGREADRVSEALPDAVPGVNVSDGLKRVAGNAEVYIRLLDQFREKHRNASSVLAAVLEKGDADAALGLAHQLKSVSGNIGAGDLSAACRNLESALRQGRVERGRELLPPLDERLRTVMASLERLTATGKTEDGAPPRDAPETRPPDALDDVLRALNDALEDCDINAAIQHADALKRLCPSDRRPDAEAVRALIGAYDYDAALNKLKRFSETVRAGSGDQA